MYCPQCGTYFKENITSCPVCEERLIKSEKNSASELRENNSEINIPEEVFEEMAERIGDIIENDDSEETSEEISGDSHFHTKRISYIARSIFLIILVFFLNNLLISSVSSQRLPKKLTVDL